jgi:tetratricopeptide (TPR) repeat protein
MYTRRDAFRSRVRWRTTLNSGRRSRIFTHIVWPSYGYPVYYRHGPDLFVSYYRPSFHRKYIFFGIGDFWPFSYTYVRYYWYGWYPYNWYGCYPTAAVCQTPGDTYNYYTYNTYNYDSGTAASDTSAEYAPPLQGVDENTFADIRQKLAAEQQQQPDSATLTDKLFEQGVNDFEQGDYDSAARAFGNAVSFEPNDLILPFAYVQALFASGQYSNAADVLRQAIEQMPVDRQGLFFPRGLYSNDDIFFAQVEQLQSKAASADDADLSLLLAYQLMGQEKYDDARDWLTRAANYDVNQNTAAILIDLLNRVEEQPQNDSGNT